MTSHVLGAPAYLRVPGVACSLCTRTSYLPQPVQEVIKRRPLAADAPVEQVVQSHLAIVIDLRPRPASPRHFAQAGFSLFSSFLSGGQSVFCGPSTARLWSLTMWPGPM